jgi:hypothetical protein
MFLYDIVTALDQVWWVRRMTVCIAFRGAIFFLEVLYTE